jgi:hypothetical protein
MSTSLILIVVAYGVASFSALIAAMVRVSRDYRKLRRENGAACPAKSVRYGEERAVTIVKTGAPGTQLVHN